MDTTRFQQMCRFRGWVTKIAEVAAMPTMLLTSLLVGCAPAVSAVRVEAPVPSASPLDLDAPGPLIHEAVVSARWAVPLEGLIDLTDPRAAALEGGRMSIVLPVHVLVHPEAGVFVVDTGVPAADSPVRGLLAWYTSDVEPVEPLADILARQPAPLAGVLLTHTHLDHVLGLPDVPVGVPVYAGPGEERADGLMGRVTFPTLRRALGDRPLSSWDFDAAEPLGPVSAAIDVIGDGSLWALSVPGHTPGSTAYLARTQDGPVLFTGDCSHTRWGWDHDVTPGTYTADHEANAASLASLRALAAEHPGMQVFVGHEL
jgi:N-acyl homoserine lactone hydrolase